MRKTSFAVVAVTMLAMSVPALADAGIDIRMVDLQRQVDAGKRSGKLSLGERQRLTNEIRATRQVARQYQASGGRFTRPEKRIVQNRLDRIQLRISTWKRNAVRGPNDVPF